MAPRFLRQLTFLVLLSMPLPASAGPLEDALTAHSRRDDKLALELLLPLAEAGAIEALDALSHIYRFGEGVPVDYGEALKWSRRSAALGSAVGQKDIGGHYFFGHGVVQDYVSAMEWFRKSAEQGDRSGLFALAQGYLAGLGVVRDDALGIGYLRAAAGKGHEDALLLLAKITLWGTNGVATDPAEAVRLAQLAAEQRYAEAQAFLGSAYFAGMGAKKDIQTAAMWWRLAANQGCISATQMLTLIGRAYPADVDAAKRAASEWDVAHPPRDPHRHGSTDILCQPLDRGNKTPS